MLAPPVRSLVRLGALAPILSFLACAGTASRLVDRAGRTAEREVGTRVVDRAVGGAADAAEDAATGEGANDGADASAKDGGTSSDTSSGMSSASTAAASGADVPRAGEGLGSNYDFERGDRPIFMEDYASDNLGDFPRHLTLLDGNWDVVEWQGERYLRGTSGRGASFQLVLPETLPERFTLEFDVMYTMSNQHIVVTTTPLDGPPSSYEGALLQVRNSGTGLQMHKQGRESMSRVSRDVLDTPTKVKLMVDGSHAKVYVGDQRVANVPNATMLRSDRIQFQNDYGASNENPIFIGAIRVDAGGRDLYGAIEREGRVAVRGILFDTDSDVIRPESRPVLDEIGAMLREHAELRLSIEGHTDAEGSEDYNRDLSQRRADAVRAWLLDEYALDEARLRSVGMGESNPVASNETEEGRQQNRRVELVQIR